MIKDTYEVTSKTTRLELDEEEARMLYTILRTAWDVDENCRHPEMLDHEENMFAEELMDFLTTEHNIPRR